MDRNLPFSRPVRVRSLNAARGYQFDLAPSVEENEALIGLLALRGLSGLGFKGTIRAGQEGGWVLAGTLNAEVIQDCVVTLAPVKTRVRAAVRRDYVLSAGTEAAVDFDPEAAAETEVLGDEIDPGAVAAEELALAIPAYPRAAGVPEGGNWQDAGDAKEHPFAALAPLRDRLSD